MKSAGLGLHKISSQDYLNSLIYKLHFNNDNNHNHSKKLDFSNHTFIEDGIRNRLIISEVKNKTITSTQANLQWQYSLFE